MNTVQSEWARFQRKVQIDDAPPLEVAKNQFSFFAGAASILFILLRIAEQRLSHDAGTAILQGLHDECKTFFKQ